MGGIPKHSEDFERRAVAALENRGNRTAADVAQEFGVHLSRLYAWRIKYAPEETETADASNDRTGYTPPQNVRDDSGVVALLYERDQLKEEAAALRKTIVLLGRT